MFVITIIIYDIIIIIRSDCRVFILALLIPSRSTGSITITVIVYDLHVPMETNYIFRFMKSSVRPIEWALGGKKKLVTCPACSKVIIIIKINILYYLNRINVSV